ncbi:MAG TPA: VWA domain-containing protein [Rectinemataceae bacterium]|nr:VWA domain-containing protein [Rectinemataceae bacterium]
MNSKPKSRPRLFWWAIAAFAVILLVRLISNAGGGSGKGYTLQFDKDFKVGMNAVDDLGISIVLAMDVSGSMSQAPDSGGEAKYLQATRALATIASFLESYATRQPDIKVKVAVLRFSSAVEVLLPLTTLDDPGASRLNAVVSNADNFRPQNNTAIGSALELSSEILAQSGTIMRSAIVVTDGENNRGEEPARVLDAIYANRNSASTKDFPVSTSTQLISFVGFDIDSSTFRALSDRGARVTSAGDQAALEASLKDLLEADITKLEAPVLK